MGKLRLAFICGNDYFIKDIIKGLSEDYRVRRFLVMNKTEIESAIDWADIVWFEWADMVAVVGTRYPGIKGKKVIVRLHSFEAFESYPKMINWSVVDRLIFVSPHIREILKLRSLNIEEMVKTEVIYNGLDTKRYPFKERNHGFNIGWVAIIDHKKNPPLMLQIIKELVDIDPRYKLHVAGNFRDMRYAIYLNYMIREMRLQDNVFFYDWVKDINRFWDDKEYLLSTSIHEGHPYNIMEGMARGIKPVIHNFFGAKGLYEEEWLYNTCKEAVEMIRDHNYDSYKYRIHVEANWDLRIQIRRIKGLLSEMI